MPKCNHTHRRCDSGCLCTTGCTTPEVAFTEDKTTPIGLLLGCQSVESRCLQREVRAAAMLRGSYHVIARMRKCIGVEAAVVVPLGANALDALTVIGQTKQMRVAPGCCRMRRGCWRFFAAPPAARLQKVCRRQGDSFLKTTKPRSAMVSSMARMTLAVGGVLEVRSKPWDAAPIGSRWP